jgi:hypothetical protein
MRCLQSFGLKTRRKRHLGGPTYRLKNIKMDLKEMRWRRMRTGFIWVIIVRLNTKDHHQAWHHCRTGQQKAKSAICSADVIREEALAELTLGWSVLQIWVFTDKTTDKFIPGLDVLWAYDTVVDLKHHMLRVGEVSLCCPHTSPRLFLHTMASDVMLPQWQRVETVQLEGPLEAANSQVRQVRRLPTEEYRGHCI